MKKEYAALALILCLTLAGCGPRRAADAPTPTPEASPSAAPEVSPSDSPLPDPETDPREYLLACLDWAMEGETVPIRFWQHPGSGPSSVELSVADHGQDIRALFSALDWEITEGSGYTNEAGEAPDAPYNQPGAYSVSIYYGDPWAGELSLGTGNPVVMVSDKGSEPVYLRADGAEELCDRLADLTPDAYIQLGRTRVPPQASREATLKLYLETALERLKENGHITDYTLDAYEIIVPEEGVQSPEPLEYPGIPYTVTYSLKPTHPELNDWEGLVGEDGWVEQTIDWEFIDYDDRDGRYGMY